ncbi:hypothetical protein AQF52_0201 [Streptomyces venezuelae]|nr:hypothetical protein AQF52_0201 [Streptomyces venezuelae]CUM43996.1 hypothetical protein BN2537_16957 [Streptomyces venezuelae]
MPPEARSWIELRPELVAVIPQLYQEHAGAIDDADLAHILAELRASLPQADLPAVLEAAFGRDPDSTSVDYPPGSLT